MDWRAGLREMMAGLVALCALVAVMDLLIRDERAAFGLRAVCALAAALCAVRHVLGMLE